MPIILWNEASPADSDSAGLGDDAIRSMKTSIRAALDGEHVFPSGGGDAGVHRLGSSRPFVGAQSLVSSAGTDGRLMWTSDTSRFFHVGSGGTALIGGQNVLSIGSGPHDDASGAQQRFYWAMEAGQHTTLSGATTVTFPRSGFSAVPYMTMTQVSFGAAPAAVFQIFGITKTSATINSFATGGGTTNTVFDWIALGPRVL